MDHWELARPTYIENWPDELARLSIAQGNRRLTLEQARDLGRNIMEWGAGFYDEGEFPANGQVPDIDKLRWDVSTLVEGYPNGAFVRLGSRSPKDSWLGHQRGFKITKEMDPLELMLDASERISDDLHLALAQDYRPHIWVREWVDLQPWQEFRCFMRDRRLVGISEYSYLDEVDGRIAHYCETIEFGIRHFFNAFRHVCHLDSVVFDVFVKVRERGDGERMCEVKLLEINPFFNWTDPCLFSWKNEGDFDGSFRFRPPEEETPQGTDKLAKYKERLTA